MYFAQDYILFHPYPLEPSVQLNFAETEFEEVSIAGHDSVQICGVLFNVDNPKGIVIYHHGNTGNIQACGWHHEEFTTRGYCCLIWDYRTYGKTPGPRTEENFYQDGLSVFDWVSIQHSGLDIYLWGASLGTGIAAHTASKRNCKHLVLEAPYVSIEDIGTRQYPIFPKFIVKYPLRTHEHFPKIKCPITLFHGTNDNTIYWQSSEKLQALNPSSTFVKLDGVGHNNISEHAEYQKVVMGLLGDTLVKS